MCSFLLNSNIFTSLELINIYSKKMTPLLFLTTAFGHYVSLDFSPLSSGREQAVR